MSPVQFLDLSQHQQQRIRPVRAQVWDRLRKRNSRSLLDIINLGLHRKTFEQLMHALETEEDISHINPESPGSNAYLAKILREEVTRQFSETFRPFVELVMNGIDARDPNDGGPYFVDVQVTNKSFNVTDTGRGISLRSAISTLFTPFHTEKDPLYDLGRFGVGFWPSLQFCLERPKEATVNVCSNTGERAYRWRTLATGAHVDDLVTTVQRISSRRRGTTVGLNGIKINAESVVRYLQAYLHFFDPRRAIIQVNRKVVNLGGDRSVHYEQLDVPVELEYKGQPVQQRVRVGVEPVYKGRKGRVACYAQGILVQNVEVPDIMLDIDLPSAVKVVEGRDDFKEDENYDRVMRAAFQGLAGYIQRYQDNLLVLGAMREAIPSLHKMGQGKERLTDEVVEECFPGKSYLIMPSEGPQLIDRIEAFFGRLGGKLYLARSQRAAQFWRERNILEYPEALIDHHTQYVSRVEAGTIGRTVQELIGSNSCVLDDLLLSGTIVLVRLPGVKKTRSPFLRINHTLYLNIGHRFLEDPGYTAHFATRHAFLSEQYGEKGMEDRVV